MVWTLLGRWRLGGTGSERMDRCSCESEGEVVVVVSWGEELFVDVMVVDVT